MDAASGQVLYERNADAQRPPASTTKIMTAILLIEKTRPDDMIAAGKKASETDGSSLNLVPGETVSARDMLRAILMRSANDACVAVAEHIAGSEEKFAELMNLRAAELGASNTRFRNCNGLPCEGHVSSARDLALLARFASRYPEFNEATRSLTARIKRTPATGDTLMVNHCKRFLRGYRGADGVKTGFTVAAGNCFVGGATRNGWRLISVVLNSPDFVGETSELMDYGFAAFEPVSSTSPGAAFWDYPIGGGAAPMGRSTVAGVLQIVATRGAAFQPELRAVVRTVKAPVAAGQVIGELQAWHDGVRLAAVSLVATAAVGRAPVELQAGGARSFVAMLGIGVIWYAAAFAESARGRRRRLPQTL